MQVQCGINIEMSTGKFVEYNMAIESKLFRDIVAPYRQIWCRLTKQPQWTC